MGTHALPNKSTAGLSWGDRGAGRGRGAARPSGFCPVFSALMESISTPTKRQSAHTGYQPLQTPLCRHRIFTDHNTDTARERNICHSCCPQIWAQSCSGCRPSLRNDGDHGRSGRPTSRHPLTGRSHAAGSWQTRQGARLQEAGCEQAEGDRGQAMMTGFSWEQGGLRPQDSGAQTTPTPHPRQTLTEPAAAHATGRRGRSCPRGRPTPLLSKSRAERSRRPRQGCESLCSSRRGKWALPPAGQRVGEPGSPKSSVFAE